MNNDSYLNEDGIWTILKNRSQGPSCSMPISEKYSLGDKVYLNGRIIIIKEAYKGGWFDRNNPSKVAI